MGLIEEQDAKGKDIAWYIKIPLFIFPVISVVANVTVSIVFSIISSKLRSIDTMNSTSLMGLYITYYSPRQIKVESVFNEEWILVCMFAMFIVFSRYMEIEKYYSDGDLLNKASLYFGTMFIFGKMMVLSTKCISSGNIPSFTYLMGATSYGGTQLWIYYKNYNKHAMYMQTLRFVFCIGLLGNMLLFGFFMNPPTLHLRDRFGFDLEHMVTCCVLANVFFQHVWSFHVEKLFHGY